jgi:hypothetical protein
VKARPLMKTSVLRSRRVNLFKNQVHSIERPRRMFTHCYIVAFESRGTQTAFNAIRLATCAISSKQTFAFLISFVRFSDGGILNFEFLVLCGGNVKIERPKKTRVVE